MSKVEVEKHLGVAEPYRQVKIGVESLAQIYSAPIFNHKGETMQLVVIDNDYIEYLRSYDDRVRFNKDESHSRPYAGILFQFKNNVEYFAPLTSSGKGKKLKDNPLPESIIFYPIKDCLLGGIRLNNMIPVTPDVYKRIDMRVDAAPSTSERQYRELLIEQLEYLFAHKEEIVKKARKLHRMKINQQLYPHFDNMTCDFAQLERACKAYKQNS